MQSTSTRALSRAITLIAVAAVLALAPAPARAAFPGANGPLVWSGGGELWRLDPGSTTPVAIPGTAGNRPTDPAVSPDGRRVAYNADTGDFGSEGIFVIGIEGGATTAVAPGATDDIALVRSPSWSPDGQRIAFEGVLFEGGSAIYVAMADGSGVQRLTDPAVLPAGDPAWSPDGQTIAATVDGALWLLDAQTGAGEELVAAGQDLFSGPDWAPDGSAIAVTCQEFTDVCIVPTTGGAVTSLLGEDEGTDPAWSPDGEQIAFSRVSFVGESSSSGVVLTVPAGGGSPVQVSVDGQDAQRPSWGVAGGPAVPPSPTPDPDPGTPPVTGSGVVEVFDGDPSTTERADTSDPTAAAVGLSEALYEAGAARHVVLSRDDAFADSLAGSVLVGDGPLLFTSPTALTASTAAEIDRVLPPGGRIYVLGGASAVSEAIVAQLRDAGYDVRRLSGPSRIETALAVADEARTLYGTSSVLLARSEGVPGNESSGWADSVSGGGVAAFAGLPVLITPTASLHPAVAAWFAANPVDVTYLLGGTAALSPAVEAAAPGAFRIAGADRTETAALIAERLFALDEDGPRQFVVINGFRGDGWQFGLAATAMSFLDDAPILLVGDQVSPATAAVIASCGDPVVDLVLMGDAATVSTAVEAELDRLDGGAC